MTYKFVRGNHINVMYDIPKHSAGHNPPIKGDCLTVVKRIYAGWLRVKNHNTNTLTNVRNGLWLANATGFGIPTSNCHWSKTISRSNPLYDPHRRHVSKLDILIRENQIKQLERTVVLLENKIIDKNEKIETFLTLVNVLVLSLIAGYIYGSLCVRWG